MSREGRPVLLKVVRGDATAEETAALIAALATARAAVQRANAAAARPGDRANPRPGWRDRSRLLRAPIAHGPGAWRASALPR